MSSHVRTLSQPLPLSPPPPPPSPPITKHHHLSHDIPYKFVDIWFLQFVINVSRKMSQKWIYGNFVRDIEKLQSPLIPYCHCYILLRCSLSMFSWIIKMIHWSCVMLRIKANRRRCPLSLIIIPHVGYYLPTESSTILCRKKNISSSIKYLQFLWAIN